MIVDLMVMCLETANCSFLAKENIVLHINSLGKDTIQAVKDSFSECVLLLHRCTVEYH